MPACLTPTGSTSAAGHEARLLGTRVGARLALRLPRVVGALGAGRACRVGDRHRLSDVGAGWHLLGPLKIDSLCLGPAPGDQSDVLDAVGVGAAVSERELEELGGSIGLDVSAIGTSEEDLLRHNDPEATRGGPPRWRRGGASGRPGHVLPGAAGQPG